MCKKKPTTKTHKKRRKQRDKYKESTHPRELSHKSTALEDVPDVDVSAGTAGHQRAGILLVRSRLEEQELGDAQVTIHCTKLYTHTHEHIQIHKSTHKCIHTHTHKHTLRQTHACMHTP